MSGPIEDARRALEHAYEELRRHRVDLDPLRLRNACEKGWLSMLMVTDKLLAKYGYERPEGYSERRKMLEELEAKDLDIAELGFRDRFGAGGVLLTYARVP